MSTAKAKHLKLCEWASMPARQHTACVRSATRGAGPRKQCEEVALADFVKGAISLADEMGVPVGLERSAVISYFFMLREIELGTMLNESVEVDSQRREVTIRLSASKTDPTALSCTRSWGCVCAEGSGDPLACLFHAAAEQKEELRKTFGNMVDSEGFPFYPTPRVRQ